MADDLLTIAAAITRRINGLISFFVELQTFILAINEHVLLNDDDDLSEILIRSSNGIKAINTLYDHISFLQLSGILSGVEEIKEVCHLPKDLLSLLENLDIGLQKNAKERLIWNIYQTAVFHLLRSIARKIPPADPRAVAYFANFFRSAACYPKLIPLLEEQDLIMARSVLDHYPPVQRKFAKQLGSKEGRRISTHLWIGPAIDEAELEATLGIALAVHKNDQSKATKAIEYLKGIMDFLTTPRNKSQCGFDTFFSIGETTCLSEIAWQLRRSDTIRYENYIYLFDEPSIFNRSHLAAIPDRHSLYIPGSEIRSSTNAEFDDDPIQYFFHRQFYESDYCKRILPLLIKNAWSIDAEIRSSIEIRKAIEAISNTVGYTVGSATTKGGAAFLAYAIIHSVDGSLTQSMSQNVKIAATIALTEFIYTIVRKAAGK